MAVDYEMIGRRIRELRKMKGMTQIALADEVNLSPTYLSYLENGNKKPSINTVVTIANALGVTSDEILCGNLEYNPTEYHADIDKLFSDCSKYEKIVILDTAKTMKDSIRRNITLTEGSENKD